MTNLKTNLLALTSLLIFILISTNLNAQLRFTKERGAIQEDEYCSFESTRDEYYRMNPKALIRAQEFEKKIQQKAHSNSKTAKKAAPPGYVIPVVFHIYGTDWENSDGIVSTEEVTDELVREALQKINADFKGFNDPVDPYFKNIEGGMDIEFRLAQVDPDGNTTSGIIHHEYRQGFALNSQASEAAKYAWDNYKYMNVHIQVITKTGSRNKSGTAWLPDAGMSDEGSARVVYNGRYMTYRPPASSLTHEFGHFFGLEHTFEHGGCVAGGTDAGDYVADTPPTEAGAASDPDSEDPQCLTDVTNCFQQRINYQNHMDYNPCESMFTKGQVARMESFMEDPSRITLWQEENLEATGVHQDLGPRVLFTYQDRLDNDLYKYRTFVEGFENEGVIVNKRKIKAIDGAVFSMTGELTEGEHFSTTNIPSGFEVTLTVIDVTTAEISIEGQAQATAHENSDSFSFQLTLKDAATTGNISEMYDTGTYRVEFLDTYEIYYEALSPFLGMGYSMQNRTSDYYYSNFSSLGIEGAFKFDLRNYNGNQIAIDNTTMEMDVLCEPNSINVKLISEGDIINSNGNWVSKPAQNSSPPIISSEQYTVWHGKSGYAGVRVPTINGDYIYAWLKVKVSADGEMAYVTNLGLNPDIGNSIATEINVPHIAYSTGRFLEAVADDATVGNNVEVTLHSITFNNTGALIEGIHYAADDIPGGTNLEVIVTGSTTATISLTGVLEKTGREEYFGWDTYRGDLRIEFLNAAFTNNDASTVLFTEFTPGLEFIGDIYSEALSDKVYNTTSGDDSGASFTLQNSFKSVSDQSMSYAIQWYDEDAVETTGVKFISWRKDAVANDDYELIPLDEGTLIGPDSPWKNGRQHYVGSGQHMIDSDDYQEWRGKTKYVGIRIRRSGRLHYGWIKLKVSSQAKRFEFMEFGLNGTPEAGIYAGTEESDGSAGYCEANGDKGVEAITKVTFANINNASDRDDAGYTNYSNIIAHVERGNTYNLSVEIDGYSGGSKDEIYAWIDWNKDLDFDDAGEYTLLDKTTGLLGEASITVPQNMQSGNIKMRIRVAYHTNSNVPCENTKYGEVEDYTLNASTGPINTNVPPTVNITSPEDGTIVDDGSAITITATASDSDGSVSKVEFYDGSSKIGEDSTAPYSFTWTNPSEGTHEIRAVATDNEATAGASSIVNITTVTSSLPDYCAANGEKGPESIIKVSFAGINNSSERASSGYQDHTNVSTSISVGSTRDLTVEIEGYKGGDNDEIYAWFDWNRDGDFEDTDEFIALTKTAADRGEALITVPDNASEGATLMRIRVAYYNNADEPCGEEQYGEVEDYTIYIVNANKISGANDGISNTVTVYPNPVTNGELNIDFNTSEKGTAIIQMYNMSGKKVLESVESKEGESTKKISINTLNLVPGVYLLSTQFGENIGVTTNKIIIN